MRSEELETIVDYICNIDSIICAVRDSCEFNMYSVQQGALDIACKYISELEEYMSKL